MANEKKTAPVAEEKKTVTIRLPKDRQTNEDLYCSVNDETFIIQRGVDVEVPWYVAELIQNCERQRDQVYEYIERNSK